MLTPIENWTDDWAIHPLKNIARSLNSTELFLNYPYIKDLVIRRAISTEGQEYFRDLVNWNVFFQDWFFELYEESSLIEGESSLATALEKILQPLIDELILQGEDPNLILQPMTDTVSKLDPLHQYLPSTRLDLLPLENYLTLFSADPLHSDRHPLLGFLLNPKISLQRRHAIDLIDYLANDAYLDEAIKITLQKFHNKYWPSIRRLAQHEQFYKIVLNYLDTKQFHVANNSSNTSALIAAINGRIADQLSDEGFRLVASSQRTTKVLRKFNKILHDSLGGLTINSILLQRDEQKEYFVVTCDFDEDGFKVELLQPEGLSLQDGFTFEFEADVQSLLVEFAIQKDEEQVSNIVSFVLNIC